MQVSRLFSSTFRSKTKSPLNAHGPVLGNEEFSKIQYHFSINIMSKYMQLNVRIMCELHRNYCPGPVVNIGLPFLIYFGQISIYFSCSITIAFIFL